MDYNHFSKDELIARIENLEQALHKSKSTIKRLKEGGECRFQELISTINSGVAVYKVINDGKCASDYIVEDFNNYALKLEGKLREDIIGKTLLEIRPNVESFGIIEVFRKVWKTGKPEFYPAKVYIDENFANYYENKVFKLPSGEIAAIFDDVTEHKKTAKKLKETFDISPSIICKANVDSGYFIEVNQAVTRILGYTAEEFKAKKIIDFIHPDDVERTMDEGRKQLKGKEVVFFENRYLCKNGSYKWMSWYTSKANENDIITGIASDITERKQAEEKLKVSESRLRLAQKAGQVGIWSIDLKTGEQFLSEEAAAFHGLQEGTYSKEDMYGMVPEEDLLTLNHAFQQTIEDGKAFNVEHRIINKNTKTITWVDARGQAIYDADGTPIRVMGTALDTTEKKAAELALAEQNNFITSIIDNLPIGFGVNTIDDGKVKYLNTLFQEIYGWPKEVLTNTSIFFDKVFADPEYREKMTTQIIADMQSGDRERMVWKDLKIVTSSGEERFVTASNIPLIDQNQMISTVVDTTKLKLAEMDLMVAKDNAEESDRLKSAFLANMSHEIRTPMNGILGFTGLLQEPGLSGEDQKNYLKIIEKSGARMLSTINDIVDISKIESGQVDIILSEINLNTQLDELLDFFRPEATNKNIKLSITSMMLPIEQANFKSDKEKINSVLTNFIKNAIKYTHSGSIHFGYSIKGNTQNEIEFYVKDTGIGIPKERQEAVFNRFVQADIEDRQAFEGSGLGLAISKAYIEMLDGKIWVESKEGVGSEFYFSLPYNRNKQRNNETTVDTLAPVTISKKLKILIAEDDEFAITLLKTILKKYGESILIARTGTEAVDLCRNHSDIDFILMDIKLPGINGYKATQQIREFNKEVFIVAQTAYAQSGDREKSIKAGCNDYIAKPINKGELLKIVSNQF